MPSGSGRKGGVPKRQRSRKKTPVESRSVRQCIEQSSLVCSSSQVCQPQFISKSSSVPIRHHLSNGMTSGGQSSNMPSFLSGSTANILPVVQTSSVNSATRNHIVVGSRLVNISPLPSVGSTVNPFILKFKTPHIRVCQSCRQDYNGQNNTMDLVVARAERRLVSNMTTGTQFLGKESNSHYHLRLACLQVADPNFTGNSIVIPSEVKNNFTAYQKVNMISCINVPVHFF